MDEKLTFIGTGENSDIYIEYGAYLHIIKYAKAGSEDGSRGVLLGKREDNKMYIFTALEAVYTGDEGLEAPSFTKQSWERILNEKNDLYGELEMLGQYSSHSGVTPSEMDCAMQKTFFKESSVLFIFDPQTNAQEAYILNDDKFLKQDGIYIFDKYGNPIDMSYRDSLLLPINREMELREKILSRIEAKLKVRSRIYAALFVVAALISVYLTVQCFELSGMTKMLKKKTNDLQWVANSHEQQIIDLQEQIKEIQEELE